MSTKPLMLEGIVREEKSDEGLLHKMRREQQRLEEEILSLRHELDDTNREKERLERTVRNLRSQLSPLHRALRAVFGEIELAIGEEEMGAAGNSSAPQHQPGSDARWESYKQQFPGVAARIIDALLTHQQMTYGQLKVFLKADYNTVKNAAARLREAGALVKEGTLCRLNR